MLNVDCLVGGESKLITQKITFLVCHTDVLSGILVSWNPDGVSASSS